MEVDVQVVVVVQGGGGCTSGGGGGGGALRGSSPYKATRAPAVEVSQPARGQVPLLSNAETVVNTLGPREEHNTGLLQALTHRPAPRCGPVSGGKAGSPGLRSSQCCHGNGYATGNVTSLDVCPSVCLSCRCVSGASECPAEDINIS